MIQANLLAIALAIALGLLMFAIIREYGRRGVILAFPKNITRQRTPRYFQVGMIVLWTGFGTAVLFSVVLTLGILLGNSQ